MTAAVLIGLLALFSASPVAAGTQAASLSAVEREDMQCFALFALVMGQSGIDADAVAAGEAEISELAAGMTGGMMYHLGRLEGRAPDVDWLPRLADYLATVQIEELQAAEAGCSKSLADTGQAMVAWGERLQKE